MNIGWKQSPYGRNKPYMFKVLSPVWPVQSPQNCNKWGQRSGPDHWKEWSEENGKIDIARFCVQDRHKQTSIFIFLCDSLYLLGSEKSMKVIDKNVNKKATLEIL